MSSTENSLRIRGRIVRVARLESDGIDCPADPEAILSELRGRDGADLFTFVQTLPRGEPRFAYPLEWDNFAALPVSTFDHWWTKQVDRKTRNMARKGEKNGLSVRETTFDESFARGISDIYNESPVRQGKRFWHYGKPVETVQRENATFIDRAILIGAFVDDRLVGFLKMVVSHNRQQAQVMQILSMMKHRDKAPTNALIAQAVRACADRQIPYLVYSHFAYGKKQRDSLADFKVANGFQRVDVPRYYVPLNRRGRMALRLGLHHRLAERIPESVLMKVRRTRAMWYARIENVPKEAL